MEQNAKYFVHKVNVKKSFILIHETTKHFIMLIITLHVVSGKKKYTFMTFCSFLKCLQHICCKMFNGKKHVFFFRIMP